MRRDNLRPSAATIISAIALFVALGGTGYAALSKNSVGRKQLKPSAVSSIKIKNHAVTRKKLARNAVGEAQIGTDVVTGRNIQESTLAQVPSAVRAGTAETVDAYVPFGIVTAGAGESRTLVSYGPFSLIGKCVPQATEVSANVVFATTEEHTSFGGDVASSGDAGPGTPEAERAIEEPGALSTGEPENSDGHDQFDAQAPSGRSWAGTVESWASEDAEQCRWSGFILKTS
jgi:hypothetical protein